MRPMTTPSDGDTVHVKFDDNRLLPQLYGEHDKHLAQIENRLGVSLISRGNHLAIIGPVDAMDIARSALDALYRRLIKGQSVDVPEVDAAVRMARGGFDASSDDQPIIKTWKKRIAPRSPTQARYIEAITERDLVFGLGPAGTGKTYLAVCAAVAMMNTGQIDKIILSRPAVEAGERLGFLPGDMRDKVDPYLRPLYDALYDTMPGDQVARRMESGEIDIAPLAFMRGRTLSNAFVILDEAQNTTRMQMKMFLTRLGENSRMVVTGDLSQVDLPSGIQSGLSDAVEVLKAVEGACFIRFTDADVVRHDLVARIVRAYEARNPTNERR